MIDSRLLVLRTFATCGTVAATAELLGYSPSAVSAQLREYQRAVGMQLLIKDGRGLRLTATGRYLVDRTDQLVAEWENIHAVALGAGDQLPKTFGVGGFSTAASNLLAPLAAHLKSSQPDVNVHVVEAPPARCFDLLIAERIDLAVVVAMQADVQVEDDPRFEQLALLDDPLDIMVSATHPAAQRRSVTLQELAREAWIADAPGSSYRALFTSAFTAAGITPKIAHEIAEWETGMALVEVGVGVGLVPRLASFETTRDVVRVRISGEHSPTRKIVAVMRTGSLESPLIKQSIAHLRETARNILGTRLQK
jgi:DNA-binding transcriptional LysR family regulator